MLPNQEQWLGLLRAALIIIGTTLVNLGWINATDWASIMGAIIVIAPLLWGFVKRSEASLIKTAASIDSVSKVELKDTKAGIELASKVGSTPTATVTVKNGA